MLHVRHRRGTEADHPEGREPSLWQADPAQLHRFARSTKDMRKLIARRLSSGQDIASRLRRLQLAELDGHAIARDIGEDVEEAHDLKTAPLGAKSPPAGHQEHHVGREVAFVRQVLGEGSHEGEDRQ